MLIFYTDHFVLPLPAGHRFPMQKYARLRERVAGGLVPPHELRVPEAATDEQLGRVHTADYIQRVASGLLSEREFRRIGFPWSPQMVERSRRSAGATVEVSRAAFGDGVAVNLAGGTHHAFADRGEGFCIFNDVAVAVRAMQAEGRASRFAVIDCDVHQGNGTASIFRSDEDVFTVSIHGASNFPFEKETSDLDLALPDRTGDAGFLDAVRTGLKATLAHGPDLVFYLAGADPWEGDRLGRLAVTREGLAERDRLVLEGCATAGVPVALVMSGGYAADVDDIVAIHYATVERAAGVSERAVMTRR